MEYKEEFIINYLLPLLQNLDRDVFTAVYKKVSATETVTIIYYDGRKKVLNITGLDEKAIAIGVIKYID